MKKLLIVLLSVSMLFAWHSSYASTQDTDSSNQCSFDHTIQVAVYQSGPYIEFRKVFYQFYKQLVNDKYIKTSLDVNNYFEYDAKENLEEIINSSKGGCVEFAKNGFYDARWDNALDEKLSNELKQRVLNEHDIDLIVVLGTVSSKRLALEVLEIPVMIMAATDVVGIGISKMREFSNIKNVHALIEPYQLIDELRIFHDLFSFKKLGVVIDDDPEIQIAQGIRTLEKSAKTLGFELIKCQDKFFNQDKIIAQQKFEKCTKDLSSKVDAFYILHTLGLKNDELFSQISPLVEKDIPVLSHNGPYDVERGALLSFTDSNQSEVGKFEALVLKRIFHGEKPNRISQYFYRPILISLNIKTAEIMHWRPDFKLLATLDRLYRSIKKDSSPDEYDLEELTGR